MSTSFSDATYDLISSGPFSSPVNGNLAVFDDTSYADVCNASHVNGYNTADVCNNNLQKYRRSHPPNLVGLRSRNDRQRPELERLRNVAEYFPPPTIHPVLAAHLSMPESRSQSQSHNLVPTLPFFNGNPPGTQMNANDGPDNVTNMPPQLKATFSQLMQRVQQTTSSSALQGQGQLPPDDGPAEDQINIEEEAVDDDSAGYDSGEESEDDEEQEERDKRMQEPTSTIASGLANLTLNEQLRPALSQVKSSPSLPLSVPEGTPSGQSFYAAEPCHAESTQDLPAHIRYPFIASNNAVQPPVNPSAASGIQPAFIQSNNPVGRGPVFNNIEGDYNKTDNTIKNHFIGSGNTTNNLVQDSFNNHSVRASNYKSSEKRRLRK